MRRSIVGYHRDDEQHWVAELECGHNQHVRHDPPWQVREWVVTPEGRAAHLGTWLDCRLCDDAAPAEPIGFREVASAMHRAAVVAQQLDFAAAELRLGVRREPTGGVFRLRCEGVSRMQWLGDGASAEPGGEVTIATIGLERLGPGEPWRFYLRLLPTSELELACARCWWNDAEVAGVGRCYRDQPAG